MINYISPLPLSTWNDVWPRRLSILGSTGSIGVSTLDVVARQPGCFEVMALAGAKNVALLAEQARKFKPMWLGVLDEDSRKALQALLPGSYQPEIVVGPEGYAQLASLAEADLVVSAQVGAAGLAATYAAAQVGKVIALANKESLVLAGHLIRRACHASGAILLPVDSEHNALFQCLIGQNGAAARRIILTASGGPFRGKSKAELAKVQVEDALRHPNWSMGAKITIDSSTLMNKGLEVIEAFHLYGLPLEAIEVVVHPESIIHSLVEYGDGSQLAQLGAPDMRVAIAYCLGFPERLQTGVPFLDIVAQGSLHFYAPDLEAFPCLSLAKQALASKNGATVVLNAANELAVEAFLQKRLSYTGIGDLVDRTLDWYAGQACKEPETLPEVMVLDQVSRQQAAALLPAR